MTTARGIDQRQSSHQPERQQTTPRTSLRALADHHRLTGDAEWALRGACRDVDPESLFVSGAAQHKAKAVCFACPVRIDCLADALDSQTEFGVWGGLTERERRELLRRMPAVPSWREFLSSEERVQAFGMSRRPRRRSTPGNRVAHETPQSRKA